MGENANQRVATIDFTIPEKLALTIAREAADRGSCSSSLVAAALKSCPNIQKHFGKPTMKGRMPPSPYRFMQHNGSLVRKCYSMPHDLRNALRIAASTERKSLVRVFSERMREYLAPPLAQDVYRIALNDDETEVEIPIHMQEDHLQWLSERHDNISEAVNNIISGRRGLESQLGVQEKTTFLGEPEQYNRHPEEYVVLSIKESNVEWLKLKSHSLSFALNYILQASRDVEEAFSPQSENREGLTHYVSPEVETL